MCLVLLIFILLHYRTGNFLARFVAYGFVNACNIHISANHTSTFLYFSLPSLIYTCHITTNDFHSLILWIGQASKFFSCFCIHETIALSLPFWSSSFIFCVRSLIASLRCLYSGSIKVVVRQNLASIAFTCDCSLFRSSSVSFNMISTSSAISFFSSDVTFLNKLGFFSMVSWKIKV